ncbi:DinB family protein [Actinophytocola sp.]|uniref:DinB family protein n=1 Tax=Actinophytocola sp. TaxID=1872138 RepID=UPI002ED6ACF2
MTSIDTRPDPPKVGGEREQLVGFLDFLRATVVLKASGLTDEQARRQLVPSELTTVAGLVAHLTFVEQYWFAQVLDGKPDEWVELFKEDPDAEFRIGMKTPLTQLIADYEAECQRSRDVAGRLDLDGTGTTAKGQPVNLRWVLIHMIEETGRHAGHLDLLRELLDGSTGE